MQESFQEVHIPSCVFMRKMYWSLQVSYYFQESSAATLEGKIWMMPGQGLDSAVLEGVF